MQNTSHPYKDILNAIAEGRQVEWQIDNGNWVNEEACVVLEEIAGEIYCPERYRIKPEVITVLSTDIPEPLRVKPNCEVTYYVPWYFEPSLFQSVQWGGR